MNHKFSLLFKNLDPRERNSIKSKKAKSREKYRLETGAFYLPKKVLRIEFVGKGVGSEITNLALGFAVQTEDMYDRVCVNIHAPNALDAPNAYARARLPTSRLTASKSTGGKEDRPSRIPAVTFLCKHLACDGYGISTSRPFILLSEEIKSRITERNKHADIIIRI